MRTRFPPEASGYIHIGHAKAAFINRTSADEKNGTMVLRFDDTNPDKENHEYEKAIIDDLGSLGIKFDGDVTFASDFFPQMMDYAEKLIKEGKAYCDDTPQEEMQKQRFDGIASKNRDHTIEDNLKLWDEMKNGTKRGLETCLRAKMSVDDPNKCLRDPVIYRTNLTPHPRHGDKYKVYPTYDFACPIVDSLQGVTDTLRTSEYNDRNAQFYWLCDALELANKPAIDDYSRLNMEYTVMSKRKLTEFVQTGRVWGWDDPRMPTVRGLLRRGLLKEALAEFVKQQGRSKSINVMEWEKIWSFNKAILEKNSNRLNAVDQFRVAVTVTDGPDPVEYRDTPLKNPSEEGTTRPLAYGKTIFLEEQDVTLLKDGDEVTLLDWGNAFVDKIEKTEDGQPRHVTMHLHLDGNVKDTKYKLHWISDSETVPIHIYEFDHLLAVKSVDKDTDVSKHLRERTLYELDGIAEKATRQLTKGAVVQFQRRGFYKLDDIKDGVYQFFYIPDGTVKPNRLSAMARFGPKQLTLEEKKKEAAAAKAAAAEKSKAAKEQKEKEKKAKADAAAASSSTSAPQA